VRRYPWTSGCRMPWPFTAPVLSDFRDDPEPKPSGVHRRLARARIRLMGCASDGPRPIWTGAPPTQPHHQGQVMVRRLLFDGTRAVGVEVESGVSALRLQGTDRVERWAIGSPTCSCSPGSVRVRSSRASGCQCPRARQRGPEPARSSLRRGALSGQGAQSSSRGALNQVGLRYTVEGRLCTMICNVRR